MNPRYIITFPDHYGDEVRAAATQVGKSFIGSLASANPEAMIVPMINGLTGEEIGKLPPLPKLGAWVHLRVSGGDSALRVMYDMYNSFWQCGYRDLPLVRMDNAEHPVADIATLLERLAKNPDASVAIGDIGVIGKNLIEGSFDWQAHRLVFPELFAMATSGKVRVSCGYGFFAFRSVDTMLSIFEIAKRIVASANATAVPSLRWGMDAAMVLGAVVLDRKIDVLPLVPEPGIRNRHDDVVQAQLHATIAMMDAAHRLFPSAIFSDSEAPIYI